jgi:hypothetical protein
MKRIIVCGDSYMSPAIDYPNTHFSEIVAERLGYELIAYSRAGMSNGGVAIQIDTAIQQKPDLILVGTTYPDRIEFPINEPIPTEKFTVEDILYSHSPTSLSFSYEYLNKNPKIISTNLAEIVTDSWFTTFDYCDEPNKKAQSIKDWFRYLYHPDWKRQVDTWMMYGVFHQLHQSNIPYLVCRDPLNLIPKCSWINYPSLVWDINRIMDSSAVDVGFNLPYHTSFETQLEIAELLISHMKENFDV